MNKKHKNPAYRIAEVIGLINENDKLENVCKLFITQNIVANLKIAGIKFDSYKFSKISGYDFNVSK